MQAPVLDVNALIALGRLTEQALSPDGTWVAACVQVLDADRAAYVGSLWRVPMDGSAAERLLEGAFDDRGPAFRPDGTLTFISNRTHDAHGADDEPDSKARKQVWALTADGSLECLTDEPLGVTKHQWARRAPVHIVETPVLPGVAHEALDATARDLEKGPSMLRYTNMPVRHWDSWLPDQVRHLVALTPEGRRDITPERTERYPEWSWEVSEDGRTVVTTGLIPGPDRMEADTVVLVDVATGASRDLLADPTISYGNPHFSPDGSRLVVTRSPFHSGWAPDSELVIVPLDDPAAMHVLGGDWDVQPTPHAWSRDGRSVLATAAVEARGRLYAVDVDSGARRALLESGTCHALTVGEDRIVIQHSSVLTPPRLRVIDPASGTAVALAPLDGLEVDLAEHIEVEEITVTGHDGDPVHSWILSPRAGGTGQGLLWIHGGPVGDWGDVWHW
ncbi:MAG TPA: hypothetical protein VLA56_01075, partial [Pseudomonadales bacterium]|nr:hypothetical protein [Pseudomonadales bacterium]